MKTISDLKYQLTKSYKGKANNSGIYPCYSFDKKMWFEFLSLSVFNKIINCNHVFPIRYFGNGYTFLFSNIIFLSNEI